MPHTPLDAFDSTPLFMRELPTGLESDPSNLNDNTLAALQSLLHDGDPEGTPQLLARALGFDLELFVFLSR